MSDETDAGTAPATPEAAPAAAEPAKDPNWLPMRLEQATRSAERKLLEQLGVSDIEAAKKAIADAKAKAEAEKSAEMRAAEAAAKLAAAEAERSKLADVSREYAQRMMVGLTEEQKQAVMNIAGEDSAAQVRTIMTLQPTWAKAVPASPPANTAPPPTAPAAAGSSPPDHRAVYLELSRTNPFRAAQYAAQHPNEVYKSG